MSSYCFLSFAYLWTCLKQSSFIVIRKKIIRWGSHFCMSLFPSIPPSVTHYIFSGIVHHLIIIFGTHMQNNDIVRCFFHFFKILIFWAVRGQQWTTISPTKGQQIAQKEKWQLHLSCTISQEQYSIWSWFLIHLCKMIISPGIFLIFLNFDFSGC